jgi:hypothetical protein
MEFSPSLKKLISFLLLCAKHQVKKGKAKTFPESPWKGPRPKFIRLQWEVKAL